MQQSTFAGSRWRHDRDHLSPPQTQVGIRQNGDAFLAATIGFLKAARFQNHGGVPRIVGGHSSRELCVLGHSVFKSLGRVLRRPTLQERAPVSPTCLSALLGANRAPNCSPNITSSAAPAVHSYRRTSTGRSRTAARAGKIVAPSEMAIATVVIHRPSKTLG